MDSGPEKVVMSTDLPGALSRRQGKVRDLYEYPEGLLIAATDRLSAFDVVMPTGIPDKGKVLTQVSLFWFDMMKDIVSNHLISDQVEDFPAEVQDYAAVLEGRTLWVRKAEIIPIECVARGYLSGALWRAYQDGEPYCGHELPPGMLEADKLFEPIFTPTTKAEQGHDLELSREQCCELCDPDLVTRIENISLCIYMEAHEHAADRGLIVADTKLEFGRADGELILVDELLTPDSSRYWDAEQWAPGRQPVGFDKQYTRDYLDSLDWDKTPPGPALPGEVVAKTRELYVELMRRLTGREP